MVLFRPTANRSGPYRPLPLRQLFRFTSLESQNLTKLRKWFILSINNILNRIFKYYYRKIEKFKYIHIYIGYGDRMTKAYIICSCDKCGNDMEESPMIGAYHCGHCKITIHVRMGYD